MCPIKDNFFKFEEFVLGKDYSGRAWENLLLGLSSTQSQPFSPKISDHITNYLFCGNNCGSEDGFGQDLPARNIQRGRDHGIPGHNLLFVSSAIQNYSISRVYKIQKIVWSVSPI